MPRSNLFPPGVTPESVNLPRQGMGGQQTPVIYSPTFQRPLMAQNREYPYGVVPDTNPMILPANGTVISQFTIDGDNDYFVETLRAVFTAATSFFTIQIVDNRSGAALFSAPTHISLIAGTGQLPGYWSQLDWLASPAGSRATLTVTLADLSNTTNTIFLLLGGRRQLVNPGMARTQMTQ